MPKGDLGGASVLIVEDEYYLAMDIKEGVEQAGGKVVGPCADAAAGLSEIAREQPDCAVVDINLGNGPSFGVAEELQRRGVPFLFLTGYDAPSIPPGLAGIERIEKPTHISNVIAAIGRIKAR